MHTNLLTLFLSEKGDYIDLYLGSYFLLTTMTAAALGNTFSDILGIGTAFYVERLANKIGYSPPKLSPIQMEMSCSRNSANLGRVLGVTLGCLLGMCPLLFKNKLKEERQDNELNAWSAIFNVNNVFGRWSNHVYKIFLPFRKFLNVQGVCEQIYSWILEPKGCKNCPCSQKLYFYFFNRYIIYTIYTILMPSYWSTCLVLFINCIFEWGNYCF